MRTTVMLICASFCTMSALADDDTAPSAQLAASTQATSASSARAKSAETKSAPKPDTEPKALSGMSILGNQEAPKALVIVPWKSSQLGDPQGISKQLDDGRQPVDKDVFMRELSYYEIRTGTK